MVLFCLYLEKQACYSLFKIRGRSASKLCDGLRDLKFSVSYFFFILLEVCRLKGISICHVEMAHLLNLFFYIFI